MGHSAIPSFRPLTAEGSLEDLERGMVAMSLNEPVLDGSHPCIVEGTLTVRGWAHARGGIESVAVVLDGDRYDALRPIVRTDLRDYYGEDAATEGGFVLRLHPSECPPGPHTLAVVAIGREGDVVGVEGEVICSPEPLDDETRPDTAPAVDWIEERMTPSPAPAETVLDTSPEAFARMRGLALMWESRALAAEADAAASRVEAGLASAQQEAAIRMLRAAEERLRELEER